MLHYKSHFKPIFNNIEWVIPSEEFPKIGLRKCFLHKENNYMIKSFLDISFSLIMTIALSPFYIFMGLLIAKDSKGPIFFKQEIPYTGLMNIYRDVHLR